MTRPVFYSFARVIPPEVRWQRHFSIITRRIVTTQFAAGLGPGVINPLMVAVMEEKGVSMKGRYSKGVDGFLGNVFDFVITVCSNAEVACPVFPGSSTRLHWPFDDPAAAVGSEEGKLAKFREVRDQIDAKIRQWLEDRRI